MTSVTLICRECSYRARRPLMIEAGSRGVHETSSEPGRCPRGHGLLYRLDGVPQEEWAMWPRSIRFAPGTHERRSKPTS